MIRQARFGMQKESSAKSKDTPNPFPYQWFWKSRLAERKGLPCKVLARGKMNSILVEFEDGYKVVTWRYAVRKNIIK